MAEEAIQTIIHTAAARSLSGLVTLYQSGLKKAKHTILVLSLALSGCRTQVAPASPTPEITSLRLFTDRATAPLLRDLVSHYRPANVIISWDIHESDPPAILDWLKSDDSTYALTSWLPPAAWAPGGLWATPVGQDAVAFVVNPATPISTLSAAQLRAILQGRVSNWLALGGENVPLTVIARPPESAAAQLVQTMVLGERSTTLNARLATTDAAVVALVGSIPGAFGYISVGYVDDTVRAVPLDNIPPLPVTITANQYPIRAPILFTGKQPPGDDAYRAFFAWVQSEAGQRIVRQHYGALQRD